MKERPKTNKTVDIWIIVNKYVTFGGHIYFCVVFVEYTSLKMLKNINVNAHTQKPKRKMIFLEISFHFEVINQRQALFFAKYFFFEVLILWWKVPHSFYLFVCYDPSLSPQILLMLLTCFNGESFTWFKMFVWLPTFAVSQILWYTINPFDEGVFYTCYSLEHINNVYHRILHLR